MISLNDYLYDGHTILRILYQYAGDLQESARASHNQIDQVHVNFLRGIAEILEHNDFLTAQSLRLREFYKYMASAYPTLAFTFRGRVKSLIRAEEKFNGYVVEAVCGQYLKDGTYPDAAAIREWLNRFHDLIAYRIVISVPRCSLKPGENQEEKELEILYEIANLLPEFLEERGFSAQPCGIEQEGVSPRLKESVRPFYRDYIVNPRPSGYRSLHITFYDNLSRCFTELQLRTRDMDVYAEIGEANHTGYELRQDEERRRRNEIPEGECVWYDEALQRGEALRTLDLSKVDVNMFAALDNYRISDGCGLYRGRLILPLEHLSRFQNDE